MSPGATWQKMTKTTALACVPKRWFFVQIVNRGEVNLDHIDKI
jgi:hypothetical protein